MKNQPQITCLSIDCPERKSLCCDARSMLDGKEFVCFKCRKPYEGGKCNAEERMQELQKEYCTKHGLNHGKKYPSCPVNNPTQEKKPKCTCGSIDKETAREVGHFKGCPLEDEKTWWQEKESQKEDCSKCVAKKRGLHVLPHSHQPQKESLEEIVRDFTSYPYPKTKSELRGRIKNLLSSQRQATIQEVIDLVERRWNAEDILEELKEKLKAKLK